MEMKINATNHGKMNMAGNVMNYIVPDGSVTGDKLSDEIKSKIDNSAQLDENGYVPFEKLPQSEIGTFAESIASSTITARFGEPYGIPQLDEGCKIQKEYMPKATYELIEEITLAEPVSSVDRENTPSGEAYDFAKMRFAIQTFDNGASGTSYITVNNNIKAAQLGTAAFDKNHYTYAYVESDGGFFKGGGGTGVGLSSTATPTSYVEAQFDKQDEKNIKSISIKSKSGIPQGTIIEIYGVRA